MSKLDDQDLTTVVWKKLQTYVEGERSRLRDQLEKPVSELDTAIIRGKLMMCRSILALGKKRDDSNWPT